MSHFAYSCHMISTVEVSMSTLSFEDQIKNMQMRFRAD